ncbi:hypothetical protein Hanom_Chr12g01143331 [Helianthus anomalus]
MKIGCYIWNIFGFVEKDKANAIKRERISGFRPATGGGDGGWHLEWRKKGGFICG